MKKKLIAILVAAVLTLGLATACAAKLPAVKAEWKADDGRYAVLSNGGQAVQVGDYIYFINGKKDTTDTDGKNNVWGSVVRGGVYVARLTGGSDFPGKDHVYGDYQTYGRQDAAFGSAQQTGDELFSGFDMSVYTYPADAESPKDDEHYLTAKPLVNKLVASGGDEAGGLYIFDGWLYFTSPDNLKDKTGVVQYTHLSFYRVRLDGSDGQLLYTMQSANVPQYGYYHYNNALYLVFKDNDGTQDNLYSIKLSIEKKKSDKPVTLAEGITGAALQNRSTYVKGASVGDYADDFVYYTRAVDTEYDSNPLGNVLERIRPDGNGDSRVKIYNGGDTLELIKVTDGGLFYNITTPLLKNTIADDLAGIPATKADDAVGASRIETIISDSVASAAYSNIDPDVYAVAVNAEGKLLPRAQGIYYAIATHAGNTVVKLAGAAGETILLQGKSVKPTVRDGNDFYFLDGTAVYKANLFAENQTAVKVTSTDAVTTGHFAPVDIVAGYAVVTATTGTIPGYPDTAASNYLFVQRIAATGAESKAWQLSVIDPDEIPDDDD
jgi:hypothetical protein